MGQHYFPSDDLAIQQRVSAILGGAQVDILDSTFHTVTYPGSGSATPENMHDKVTNTERIYPKIPGTYLFTFVGEWEGNTNGTRYAYLHFDGSGARTFQERAAVWKTPFNLLWWEIVTQAEIDASRYFYCKVYQDSGVTLYIKKHQFTATLICK